MDAMPTSYSCILSFAKVTGGASYIGLSSSPDSYRASCRLPSALPRQVIPSGGSLRSRSNQPFQSIRSSRRSSTIQLSLYRRCISRSTLPPTGGCECFSLLTDVATLATNPLAVFDLITWISAE